MGTDLVETECGSPVIGGRCPSRRVSTMRMTAMILLRASIQPADELCHDQADNDCDGFTDEDDAIDATVWYADSGLMAMVI